MSDQGRPPPNGADEPRKSLRDIAEEAYDEVLDAAESDEEQGDAEQDVDDGTQPRDAQGRFVARTPEAQPGEAEQPSAPSPEDQSTAPQPQQPQPAAPASSTEAPANWSEQDRQMFGKLPQEAKTFLLKRHQDMEADYTRKAQASAAAVSFAQGLSPVFTTPAIAENLKAAGWSASDAIKEWAGFHLRAINPDPRVRAGLVAEMIQRLNVDPAAFAMMSRQAPAGVTPQLSEADLKDPAIRYFADHVGRTLQDVQALRGELETMRRQEAERLSEESQARTRWGIDQFASEKDGQGNLLRPYFDAVLPQMIELFRADPDRDMGEAYQTALWMNQEVRQRLVAAERQTVEQQQGNRRAAQAVRSNIRGRTNPVSAPAEQQGKRSLRDTLEQAADEVGI
jgi:hypothetical protein